MGLSSFLTRLLSEHWNPNQNCGMLYFHRLLDKPDPFFPDDLTAIQFRYLLTYLTGIFDITTPHEWLDGYKHKKKPMLMISFDDGYEDNMVAARILEEFGVRGTFFVSTAGVVAGGSPQVLWQNKVLAHYRMRYFEANEPDRESLLLECAKKLQNLKYKEPSLIAEHTENLGGGTYRGLELLDASHIRRLINKGHCVAPHTHNHYILSTLNESQLHYELQHSKDVITSVHTSYQPRVFAYPNGRPEVDFEWKHIQCIRDLGYEAAFSSHDGGFPSAKSQCSELELYQLPRFLPHRKLAPLRALSSIKIAGEQKWREQLVGRTMQNTLSAGSSDCVHQLNRK